MDVEHRADDAASRIAAAIGEPARARILYCLMDNHARTSTELAVVAGVSSSTASVHLNRLKTERLVKVLVQGKHRYYSLEGARQVDAIPFPPGQWTHSLTVQDAGHSETTHPNYPLTFFQIYDHIV